VALWHNYKPESDQTILTGICRATSCRTTSSYARDLEDYVMEGASAAAGE